jgi:putative transposase
VSTEPAAAQAADPKFSWRGEDVVRTLERVCGETGYPKAIRVDRGSEFISRDLDLWACQKGVVLDFSRPGKPPDYAFIESFNGEFMAECLNAHWFMNLDDARSKMEHWRRDCNEVRPHGATGNNTPITLMNGSGAMPSS